MFEFPIITLFIAIILYGGVTALVAYIAYRVIRAGVRDGILDAKKRAETKMPTV